MNRILLAVALVCTLLLTAIVYELHGLNQRLDRAAARNWGLPRALTGAELAAARERYQRETDAMKLRTPGEMADELDRRLNAR